MERRAHGIMIRPAVSCQTIPGSRSVSDLVLLDARPRLYLPGGRWLAARHAVAAASTVLLVLAAWAVFTAPLVVFFALAFNDVSGYSAGTGQVAAAVCAMSVVIAPGAVGLERLILRLGKGWLTLAVLVPVTAHVTVVLCLIAVALVVGTMSALVAVTAALFVLSFLLYWSTLWALNLASYLMRLVCRVPRRAGPPASGRSTFVRHALSVAATAATPIAVLSAATLPFIALGAVLDRITPPENRTASDWTGYLTVLLWTAAGGLALGILLAPIAWAFERRVLRGGVGWAALSVSAPVTAPAIGLLLLYGWLLTGPDSDVAAVVVGAVVCLLLVFPAYWSSLWLWRIVPYGLRRFRRWRASTSIAA
jgi:hypothetical protein